ncbi:MAG: thermonuclease family protein [Patescibacteria group bacterium]
MSTSHSKPKWHHHVRRAAKAVRDFHRREGAFAAIAFAFLFLLGLFQIVGAQTADQTGWPQLPALTQLAETGRADQELTVTQVVDGDTIILSNGAYVRYIGIDTPEIFPHVECYAQAATKRNKELVEGKTVQLVRDVSDQDRFGRLLRYVYVDGVFVNQLLVEEGLAYAVVYPPDLAHATDFTSAQTAARSLNLGVWKKCQ